MVVRWETPKTRHQGQRKPPAPPRAAKPPTPVPLSAIYQSQNSVDTNIACDICLSEAFSPTDNIVLCENCLVAVHQSCYKDDIELGLPEGQWVCRRCRYVTVKRKSEDYSLATCRVCRKCEGAMAKAGRSPTAS